jgi:nucleotide-binding universal stress UspA family protein
MEKLLYQNSILCVIDFSESSLKALKWTVKLASENNARVTVLFCYRLITPTDDRETLNLKRDMEEEASKKFDALQKDLVKNQVFSCDFVTEIGFYPYRIEIFLKEKPVGLIVMGNSIIDNFHDYKRMTFEQFLKNVKVPVVVVPA